MSNSRRGAYSDYPIGASRVRATRLIADRRRKLYPKPTRLRAVLDPAHLLGPLFLTLSSGDGAEKAQQGDQALVHAGGCGRSRGKPKHGCAVASARSSARASGERSSPRQSPASSRPYLGDQSGGRVTSNGVTRPGGIPDDIYVADHLIDARFSDRDSPRRINGNAVSNPRIRAC